MGSPYGWYSQNLQDYSTGFAAIFDVLISSNRSQHILTMLQDGHYIDEQTASKPTTTFTLILMHGQVRWSGQMAVWPNRDAASLSVAVVGLIQTHLAGCFALASKAQTTVSQ